MQKSHLTKSHLTESHHSELFLIVFLLAVFLVVNLATGAKFPIVWQDEALYTDPAANLYLGLGFTSSGWFVQNPGEFWAANVPLHQILLYGWLQIFGFSLLTVRSFNYAIIAVTALLFWLSIVKLNLIPSSQNRVAFIVLILLGYGISWNYRSGRPDCIGICLLAAALLSYTLQSVWLRCILLSCIAALLPISGLQVATYTVLLCGMLLIFLGKSFVKETISIVVGLAIGAGFLYILYSTYGVWDDFIASVKFVRAVPNRFQRDPSVLFLLISAVAIAVSQIRARCFRLRSPLTFGLATSVCIPLGISITSHGFPTYYYWMAFIPLAIGIFSTSIQRFEFGQVIGRIIIGSLILTCVGLTSTACFSGLLLG